MAKREKAAARVAQEIVQAIYDDRLQSGDRYLSESDALARHAVSRATFREALRFLEFQGVVRVRVGPGGGAIVQKPDWPNLTSTFALLLQFADAPLSEVMAARAALEPSMAALAAENADADTIARLELCLAEARATVPDQRAFIAAYRDFWGTIALATGNALTAMLWPALRALVDSGGFVPNERYRGTLVERMTQLLAAVVARDADAARALVSQLDQEFAQRLADLYPQRVARVIAWSDVLGE
jgi:DNA-binding FadR family transcriptional regulator